MVATRGSHGIRKPKTYHNGSAKAIEVVAPELPPPPVAQSPTDDENAAPPPPPLPSSGGSRNAIAYSPSKKARRSSMAFAPICVFSPNKERGTRNLKIGMATVEGPAITTLSTLQ